MTNQAPLLPCPFCGGTATIAAASDLVGYDEYSRYIEYLFIKCSKCGTRTKKEEQPSFSSVSEYTVQDFRNYPGLRPEVNEILRLHIDNLKLILVNKWNCRHTQTETTKENK